MYPLLAEQALVYGDLEKFEVVGADKQGSVLSPIVMLNDDPFNKLAAHNVEAFDPYLPLCLTIRFLMQLS